MRLRAIVFAVLLFPLAGCGAVDIPGARSTTGRAAELAEVPDPEETVRGASDPPIVTLSVGKRLRERRLSRSDDLPSTIMIPTTNFSAVPITTALQAILAGTEVSLSWDSGSFDDRLVSVTNLSGPLPFVVEKTCRSAKVFCVYRGGLLEIKDKETFVIELPVMPTKPEASEAAKNTMADTISEIVGEKVRLDEQGGNLLYSSDVLGHEKVEEYLVQLRHGRPLVVMQLYIWEVILNKDNATGINWNSFSIGKFSALGQKIALAGSTAFTSLSSPGVSLGATTTGLVDAQTMLQFLSTQGVVQTISNPQLTFVSGSSAEFRVGGEQRYISEVGELTSDVSGSSSTLGSNTVSTDSIETGLTVTINGSFENGVVSAAMSVDIQDIVSLNETTTQQGVTINLPETSERKVQTALRVRPGDNLVLAGLVSSRDTNDRQHVPTFFGKIPSFARDQFQNTELVLMVKPSIVMFADEEEPQPRPRPSPPADALLLDAVVIDKDGAKPIKIPNVPSGDAPEDSFARPERASDSTYSPPSDESAPVDRRMLQRGFSHAFDDLRAPAPVEGGGP